MLSSVLQIGLHLHNDFKLKAAFRCLFQGEGITMVRKKRTKSIETAEANPVTASESQSSLEVNSAAVSTQERIQLLAYSYWEKRGRSHGSPDEAV